MDRRALLELGSWSAIVYAFPSRAFGDERQGFDRDAALLERAMASARLVGKPVLAIIVPFSESQRTYRGSLWGALLQLASDEMLATLALAEVVCVRTEVVEPFGAKRHDEPYAFLIEQAHALKLTAIRAPIGEWPVLSNTTPATASVHAQWAEPLGLAVYYAIANGTARIAELALRARAALDRATLVEVERDLREPTVVPLARLERAAALYYLASVRELNETRTWFPGLASVADERLRRHAPPGVQWKETNPRYLACGVSGPCGTGYSAWPSRQFLEFLTRAT